MTKKRKISLAVISFLLSALFLLSAFMIWKEVSDRKTDKDNFQILVEMVEQDTAEKKEPETEEEQKSEAVGVRNSLQRTANASGGSVSPARR